MWRLKLFLVVLFLFLLNIPFVFCAEFEWEQIYAGGSGVKHVLIDRGDPKVIFAATKAGIIKTEDSGSSWRNIFISSGQDRGVNFLLFDKYDGNAIYAATANGLFVSKNYGKSWQRRFRGKDLLENDCTAVYANPDLIILGTKSGLFISRDKAKTWQRQPGKLASSYITAIAARKGSKESIYVYSIDGLFRANGASDAWERVFVVSAERSLEDIPEYLDEEAELVKPGYFCINEAEGSYLLAKPGKLYKSTDNALSWDLFAVYGLLDNEIRFLSALKDGKFIAATKKGIFVYIDERWREVSEGISATDFYSVSVDEYGNFYVATEEGLFKSVSVAFSGYSNDRAGTASYDGIPSISSVQEAAVKYAEVSPEKIVDWRRKAAKKAFLPKVSAGVGRDTTDLWHWESGSSTKAGDDYLLRGRDSLDWDVSLTWDLSEIIWNSEQTAIDVRSRLMVQLRDDILDEVTRLYFERVRVKMDLDNLRIEDIKRRREKEIKLDELASSIDALTGGFFSRNLR